MAADVGPGALEHVAVGDQGHATGEEGVGEDLAVDQTPAEHADRGQRQPDQDGRPGDAVGEDEEDRQQRDRGQGDGAGHGAEDAAGEHGVAQVVGVDHVGHPEPDHDDRGQGGPGHGEAGVLHLAGAQVEGDHQAQCHQADVPRGEQELPLREEEPTPARDGDGLERGADVRSLLDHGAKGSSAAQPRRARIDRSVTTLQPSTFSARERARP